MLIGRTAYEGVSRLWPGRDYPLGRGAQSDAETRVLLRAAGGDVEQLECRTRRPRGGGRAAETGERRRVDLGPRPAREILLKHELIDVIDISVHPIMLGRRKLPLRPNQNLRLRLIAAKTFARGIVTLTYEPDHG
jgi:hypothetical protein